MLRATMACTFSTSQLPNMLPTQCALYILIFPTLRSHKSSEKHSESRLLYLFAHLHRLSSDSSSSMLFSLLFSSLLFSSHPFPSLPFLSLLSASILFSDLPPCLFPSAQTVGSLTSTLTAITHISIYYTQIIPPLGISTKESDTPGCCNFFC